MPDDDRRPMIEAVGLSKRYDNGVLALDSLDLHVGAGEIYCLLGANGAGKTTTIHLFLNFIEPTGGRAFIRGLDVSAQSIEARRHTAYVSENVMLYASLTARQNLGFFARISGGPGRDAASLDRVLAQVGLPREAHDRRLREFSKGMRQKLGIAIAIVKNAPAILLDEPTSGLDPKAAAEFLEIVAALREEGRAILISTHDIFRAREMADRVGIMRSGRLLAELDRRELAAQDLQALYLEYMREFAPASEGGGPPPALRAGGASPGRESKEAVSCVP